MTDAFHWQIDRRVVFTGRIIGLDYCYYQRTHNSNNNNNMLHCGLNVARLRGVLHSCSAQGLQNLVFFCFFVYKYFSLLFYLAHHLGHLWVAHRQHVACKSPSNRPTLNCHHKWWQRLKNASPHDASFYSQWSTSLCILCFCERNVFSTPPGGKSLYLSFKRATRRI